MTEARKALAGFVVEAGEQKLTSSAPLRVFLADWLRHLESLHRADRTVTEARRTIDKVLNPDLGDVPIGELTPRHIDDLLRSYSDRSPATVRRYYAVLRGALNQAVTWDVIATNPADKASVPSIPQSTMVLPAMDEVGLLSAALPADVWRVAVKIAVLTGARRGEVCALRWSDYDGRTLTIARSVYRHQGETREKGTKGGRDRYVTVGPMLASVLEVWRSSFSELADGAFILSTWPDASRPVNPDTLSAYIRKAAVAAGIPHVHFHSLRHYAATEMLAGGIDVRTVAETLGHADGGKLALQVYGHARDDRQAAAALAMERGLSL